MLKSLTIRNFRLHKKITIDLDPHITTIVGKSYAGKSTIIRALKWLCLNKPAGMSVLRWGSKQARVSLNVDEHKITRIRSKSKNLYKLDDHKYEAFGNDVPNDVTKILNVTEINFQGQHHLPFWFGETAGEVSRRLNGIVNLSLIDTTLSKMSSMLHESRTRVEMAKEQLDFNRKRKRELAFVKKMVRDWGRVKDAHRMLEAHETQCLELENVVKRCKEHQTIINKTRPPSMNRLTEAMDQYDEAVSNFNVMQDWIHDCKEAAEKALRLRRIAKEREKEWRRAIGRRCPLCGSQKT